jgi:hypothetical protein
MHLNLRNGLMILALTVAVSVPGAYAEGGSCCKGMHGMHGKKHGGDGGSLEKKFFKKAHFLLENGDELGLTPEKVEAIKALKMETKKTLIRQDAEIEIAGMDIKAALYNFPVDIEAVNALIDQKYELKKQKAKATAGAIAKLKAELTKEQYDKLVTLWKGRESGHEHGK